MSRRVIPACRCQWELSNGDGQHDRNQRATHRTGTAWSWRTRTVNFVRRSARSSGIADLALITLMIYVASFAISLGPIFWLLISEIYSLKFRGLAAGIAAGANWTSIFCVSLTLLTLLQLLGPSWTFWLYGLLSIGAWLFSYCLVPETKGRTLEEIERFWQKSIRPNRSNAPIGCGLTNRIQLMSSHGVYKVDPSGLRRWIL